MKNESVRLAATVVTASSLSLRQAADCDDDVWLAIPN